MAVTNSDFRKAIMRTAHAFSDRGSDSDDSNNSNLKRMQRAKEMLLQYLGNTGLDPYERDGGVYNDVDITDEHAYEEMDHDLMEHYWERFHTEAWVRVMFYLNSNALFGTGMVFEEREHFVDTKKAKELRREFHTFLQTVLKNCFAFGFSVCAIEEHPLLGAIPRACDMLRLRIRVQRSLFGKNYYLFYPYTKRDWTPDDKPLENLCYFELDEPQGHVIRSRMAALEADFEEYYRTRTAMVRFQDVASNPPLVLQKQIEKVGDDTLNMTMCPPAELGETDPAARMQQGEEIDRRRIKRLRAGVREAENLNRGLPADYGVAVPEEYDPLSNTVRLNGYEVAKQQMPLPIDLAPINDRLIEKIAVLFCVPRNMFSHSSSGKSVKAGEENTREIYTDSQRSLKEFITNVADFMYNAIYRKERLKKNMEPVDVRDATAVERALDNSEMSVYLPNTPSLETLFMFYQHDLLKVEPLIHMLAEHCKMPVRWFNEKPEIGPKELAGIEEPMIEIKENAGESKSSSSATGAGKSSDKTVSRTTKRPMNAQETAEAQGPNKKRKDGDSLKYISRPGDSAQSKDKKKKKKKSKKN